MKQFIISRKNEKEKRHGGFRRASHLFRLSQKGYQQPVGGVKTCRTEGIEEDQRGRAAKRNQGRGQCLAPDGGICSVLGEVGSGGGDVPVDLFLQFLQGSETVLIPETAAEIHPETLAVEIAVIVQQEGFH